MRTSISNEDIGLVLDAASPTALFGTNERRARIRYRRLAKSVHPDANGGSAESMRAMSKLNAMWDEYNGSAPAGVPKRRPSELARSERYVILDEGDRWLVVDRGTGSPKAVADTGKLSDILRGTPVCMLDNVGTKSISQPDGMHAAYQCDVPDSLSGGLIMLTSLRDRLPSGRMHPADFAWVAKRALFLCAALCSCGLDMGGQPMECVGIAPDTHMLAVVAPWEMEDGDARLLMTPFWQTLNGMADSDKRSRRISRFLLGTAMDRHADFSGIMREYDELLYELFGPPRFHRMETS